MKKSYAIISAVVLVCVSILCVLAIKTPLFNHQTGDILNSFNDGSQIISCGGDEYEHILFDSVAIRWYNSYTMRTIFTGINTEQNNCYIDQYAFDPNGFVAVCEFVFTDDKNKNTEILEINGSEKYISEKIFYVFDCNKQNKNFFDNFDDMLSFCTQNNIVLSDWYICRPFGSEPKHID